MWRPAVDLVPEGRDRPPPFREDPQRERADRRAEPGGDRSGADDDVRHLSPLPIGARERRGGTTGVLDRADGTGLGRPRPAW
jgi:hypothetical protein